MARTAVQLWITFNPSSQLIDFLGVGYSTKGVMLAPLNSLSPIYPSHTILQLALLKRKVSARAQRAGDPDVDTDELAFMVVMFKKINNKNLPPGLTVEAFFSFLPICSPTKLQGRDMHSRQTSPHYLLTQTITFWR
jgi:hypothetical protein